MGASYRWYLLADSSEGKLKEADVTGRVPSDEQTWGDIRQGFVYERVPHITLRSIANNVEIEVIYESMQPAVESALGLINRQLQNYAQNQSDRNTFLFRVAVGGRKGHHIDFSAPEGETVTLPSGEAAPKNAMLEWEVPSECPDDWPPAAADLLSEFLNARTARQQAIDASIAANADSEYLYDKPHEDNSRVRVAGPFTVESVAPHRMLAVDENDELIDGPNNKGPRYGETPNFAEIILENLRAAGVQQAHKEDRIDFASLVPWPGHYISAEGRYVEGDKDKGATRRAGIFIGPEFGTVSRPDLVAAAREASDAGFDVLISCAFSYDAHATEFNKLGPIPILKARMNADLHMAEDLKNTGKGNLFVIFGEPDISIAQEEWIVDRSGKRIAPFDIFSGLAEVNSLQDIDRMSHEDRHIYAALACRKELWDLLANFAKDSVTTAKYRTKPDIADDGALSSAAWCLSDHADDDRRIYELVQEVKANQSSGFFDLIEELRREQVKALSNHTFSFRPPLTIVHYTQVTVNGVDVFHPNSGEVRSDGPEGIACWFIDTDYNEESFFVRHAYFLGAGDPYKALKSTLKPKDEIDDEAWASLNRATSRPFPKPDTGRIAVKVINRLGDEVMKVFRV